MSVNWCVGDPVVVTLDSEDEDFSGHIESFCLIKGEAAARCVLSRSNGIARLYHTVRLNELRKPCVR